MGGSPAFGASGIGSMIRPAVEVVCDHVLEGSEGDYSKRRKKVGLRWWGLPGIVIARVKAMSDAGTCRAGDFPDAYPLHSKP